MHHRASDTPRARCKLGRAGGETDGVAVLAVAHDLSRDRGIATQRTAELADDPPVGARGRAPIQVDVLARERRAATVGAAMAVGLERTDAALQQDTLELLDMAYRGHGLKDSLPRAEFLPGRRRPSPAPSCPIEHGGACADLANLRGLFAPAGRRVTLSLVASNTRNAPGRGGSEQSARPRSGRP